MIYTKIKNENKNPRAGLIIVKCQATEPVGQYNEQATAMGLQAR